MKVHKDVDKFSMVVDRVSKQRNGLMPLIASIGIGAACYQMLKPNNRVGQAVKSRMEKMADQKQLFPED